MGHIAKPSTAHTLHSFYIKDRPYLPCSVATIYNVATHNTIHSPCTSTCITHPALPTTLPSTTCRDGVKVLWCHFHLVLLRVSFLHALVFIKKSAVFNRIT